MILVEEGQSPLILCLPHSGTEIPDAVLNRLNATGRLQTDLSWRIERVFGFHADLDATLLRSSISRYVIDVDKDPQTPVSEARDPAVALCPVTTLDGKRIYQAGEEPGPTEIEQRSLLFCMPFHRALRKQIDRLLRKHNKIVIVNCQSMRSHIKGVTDTGLPLISIGGSGGTSCDPGLRDQLVGTFRDHEDYSVGVDGFAGGGFIERSYGRPNRGIHVVTLLLAQRAYLRHETPPFEPDKTRIARLSAVLAQTMSGVVDWVERTGDTGTKPAARLPKLDADTPPDTGCPENRNSVLQNVCASGVSADRQPDIVSADSLDLPKVSGSRLADVKNGPVTPLLVAE
ncbi:N-formylglutamate amidohydrolase [Labrenzia sp. OB1]|uniref:N-formylglutamate amidohydrolase n=1 Tax=Labrenzia sp. OB1 TaxID=1561204 RepID=UPI0007B299E4|nr:N-formylglutamate amidohydrolase [Labrenzia sp. OB1]KZM50726.1 formiminoglutamase [Labrenzia sp. OB1]